MSAREFQELIDIAREAVRTHELGQPRRFADTTFLRHTPEPMPPPEVAFADATRPYTVT